MQPQNLEETYTLQPLLALLSNLPNLLLILLSKGTWLHYILLKQIPSNFLYILRRSNFAWLSYIIHQSPSLLGYERGKISGLAFLDVVLSKEFEIHLRVTRPMFRMMGVLKGLETTMIKGNISLSALHHILKEQIDRYLFCSHPVNMMSWVNTILRFHLILNNYC